MAYPPALDESEVQRLNLRAVQEWIARSKAKIKAKPNKSVFYSGRDYDLEIINGLSLADRKEFMGTPMWKRLEQTRKQLRDLKVPCDFETLEDVLKSIRDHPTLLTRDRQEIHSANAFEFFNEITGHPKLYPAAKSLADKCWELLSGIYASNAAGEIKILDGAADDYSKLREDKIFIRRELETLLKNNKLSPAAKILLQKKISKYGDHFDRRYTELIRLLGEGKTRLKHR